MDGNFSSNAFNLPGSIYLDHLVLHPFFMQKEKMETTYGYAHPCFSYIDLHGVSGERISKIYASSYGCDSCSPCLDVQKNPIAL